MSQDIFRNKFFLTFHNSDIEKKFSDYTGKIVQTYCKSFTLCGLIISLVDTIYESLNYENSKIESELKFIQITIIMSFLVSSIFLIEVILCFIFTNEHLLLNKVITYLNYILIMFPFYNLREILYSQKLIDENFYAMIRSLELLAKLIMINLLMITTPGTYFISLVCLMVIFIYSQFIKGMEEILPYAMVDFIPILISYFYTKQVKFNFFSNFLMLEQNNWYSNLIEHMNSGFLAFTHTKINFMNKNLKKIIYLLNKENIKNSEIYNIRRGSLVNNSETLINEKISRKFARRISENIELNIPPQANVSNIKEKPEYYHKKLIENNLDILNSLLKNIKREHHYDNFPSSTIFKNSQNCGNYSVNEFNLNDFLIEMKKIYDRKNMNQKFMIIGYKEITVDKNSDVFENYSFEGTNQKILNFEILFRYQIKETNNYLNVKNNTNLLFEDEYEIIFKDITNIKEIEEKSAELNYKTLFLSKIAHEFKNPIIGIVELVEIIQESQNEIPNGKSLVPSGNSKTFDYLKQIKSLSDYLLFLIRELKYFSFINMGYESDLDSEECDIDEILNFTRDIAEVLFMKYNKKIKFSILKNFNNGLKFLYDKTKLKQVLVSLISNSIKNTNIGKIELLVNYNISEEEFIEFKITDTGIEFSEEMINNILEPWSFNKKIQDNQNYKSSINSDIELEFYVLLEILRRFKSKLKINSNSKGSIFEFKIKVEKLKYDKINSPKDEAKPIINIINCDQNSKDFNLDSKFFGEQDVEELEKSVITSTLEIENCINNTRFKRLTIKSNNKVYIKQPELRFLNDDSVYTEGFNNFSKFLIIVDDEKMTRKSTTRIMKKTMEKMNPCKPSSKNKKDISNFSYEILEAEDGLECIYLVYKLLKNGHKDIIIVSDENMKHMNGTTSAEILKNLKKLNSEHIPFILLTAYDQVNCTFIDYFVSKPMKESEAEKIINNYMNKN